MAEFLDSFSKINTRRMYRRGLELFCQWYDKDIETILEERKDDLTPRPNESFVEITHEYVIIAKKPTQPFLESWINA